MDTDLIAGQLSGHLLDLHGRLFESCAERFDFLLPLREKPTANRFAVRQGRFRSRSV
jgi:hypothetical protein